MKKLRAGSQVEWTWGANSAEGKVEKTFTADVSRKIKGKVIKRKADKQEPALLIRQKDGGRVLKSRSEVRPAHD
ncbi:hypothetical protein GAO09_28880 [Rhizobiales bacterium RZME27]|uniref:Hypervirulence associated protein TUDOR domain-containing protein n=1 Tax=Endobacterium cereale TaxID=2663029 RepID=A0A6A8AGY8_9HYPH|nr:DUF2945 domain-containing protein [Endobacterium cereale]MEB2845779.1 DUF2945 domain-containing protein [Endobacterium cereale]MQY50049.1 hypothetical protein [Endobacterium cereale]